MLRSSRCVQIFLLTIVIYAVANPVRGQLDSTKLQRELQWNDTRHRATQQRTQRRVENLESHYRANGTREILRLFHEINGKTMEPGGDPFKFMMEIDRFAADLHRLGDKSATELRKCGIIVCLVCLLVLRWSAAC